MELITHLLTGKSVNEMTTEIKFFIASCRVKSIDLFRLDIKKAFDGAREEKRLASISRILNAVKRDGLIQLYIYSTSLEDVSTEAEYIKNKYPDIKSLCNGEECYIIKL